jgi:A/G-specific adenine glycosylase
VAVVLDRYVEFIERFPDIATLAAADSSEILALWSGLGYYRRAHLLHNGAKFVMRELNGVLPRTAAELRTLPGIGEYTAAAIASIAFGQSIAVIDGNVERVLLRILGQAEDRSGKARARLNEVAQTLVPKTASKTPGTNLAGNHNQAMMELGATICLPRSPLCLQCPVFDFCLTRGEHVTAPRGKPQSRTVAYLLALRKRGTATEVLLHRRPFDAALMPGMLELPELPLDAVADREPVLRLRHAITNTNYYVLIFSTSGAGAALPDATAAAQLPLAAEEESANEDEQVYVPEVPVRDPSAALLEQIPASPQALLWCNTGSLLLQPLTGLARKTLQRIGVMAIPKPSIAPDRVG